MSSASVSSVFGWEQFSAEKGYEGSRTYVYVTAASSQPKKPHDLFFFPFSLELTACCLQTTNNNESSKAFSSICFHTHHFPFPLLWLWLCSSQTELALPEEPPASPGGTCCPQMCHGGCPTSGRVFQTGNGQFYLLLVHRPDKESPLSPWPQFQLQFPRAEHVIAGNLLHTG